MKITVLNGSPKGKLSVTMQYVYYLQKTFPQHLWEIVDVGQRLKMIEKNEEKWQQVLDTVQDSDGVLWAFPLYYMLTPANYKRFIELIWERGAEGVFIDKYVAVLTTSIHFFDHTAHNYMHAICDDLGMKYVGGFSPAMRDLMDEEERIKLVHFAQGFLDAITAQAPTVRGYAPVVPRSFEYCPTPATETLTTAGKRVLVVTDAEPEQINLLRMIERFRRAFTQEIETINMRELDIKSSCIGCLKCGYDNQCTFEGKDDYIDFYNTKVRPADILVYAGTIKDRYLSATWKTYFDRSFFMGHAPSLMGKQFAFLISGPLSQNPNLSQILESWVELQFSNLAGVVTDEYGESIKIDALLDNLAGRLVRFAESDYIKPRTYMSVAGTKLFRDEIWGNLRTAFQADHRAYKRLGVYDFPQKELGVRALNGVTGVLFKVPRVRKEFSERIVEGMVQPYQKVLEA